MTTHKNKVLTVHFCLHGKKTRGGLRQIHCRVYFKGVSRHVSTGVSIEPELWDNRREMAKGNAEESLSINAELRKVQYKTKRLMPIPAPLSRPAIDILHAWKGRNPRFVFDLLPADYDLTKAKAFFMEHTSKSR